MYGTLAEIKDPKNPDPRFTNQWQKQDARTLYYTNNPQSAPELWKGVSPNIEFQKGSSPPAVRSRDDGEEGGNENFYSPKVCQRSSRVKQLKLMTEQLTKRTQEVFKKCLTDYIALTIAKFRKAGIMRSTKPEVVMRASEFCTTGNKTLLPPFALDLHPPHLSPGPVPPPNPLNLPPPPNAHSSLLPRQPKTSARSVSQSLLSQRILTYLPPFQMPNQQPTQILPRRTRHL